MACDANFCVYYHVLWIDSHKWFALGIFGGVDDVGAYIGMILGLLRKDDFTGCLVPGYGYLQKIVGCVFNFSVYTS